MLNILPTEEKKKNLKEYHLRLGVVSFVMATSLVLVNLALLTPAYFNALAKEAEAKARIVNFTGKSIEESAKEEQEINTTVADLNKKLNLFLGSSTSTSPRFVPSEVFEAILEHKAASIKIYSISYDATLDREQLVVVGKSLDRDSLAQFVDALKKSGLFTAVDLPIQSYVKSTNIEFSVTLTRALKASAKKTK